MKIFKYIFLIVLTALGTNTVYACGLHGLYSFGSPIYIPKCIKTDGTEGFCSAAMSSPIAERNKLALRVNNLTPSTVSDSNEEIPNAIENGMTCVLNSECGSGTKCVKHRGLYGICK